jgi:hypothetical protein
MRKMQSIYSRQDMAITQLKKEMEIVVTYLKEQHSKIQKGRTQLELSKPAPQTVKNND